LLVLRVLDTRPNLQLRAVCINAVLHVDALGRMRNEDPREIKSQGRLLALTLSPNILSG
jgi:hypothetical protein